MDTETKKDLPTIVDQKPAHHSDLVHEQWLKDKKEEAHMNRMLAIAEEYGD